MDAISNTADVHEVQAQAEFAIILIAKDDLLLDVEVRVPVRIDNGKVTRFEHWRSISSESHVNSVNSPLSWIATFKRIKWFSSTE